MSRPTARWQGALLRSLGTSALDLLAPSRCVVCRDRSAPPWCASCRRRAVASRPACTRCGDQWAGHRCPFEGTAIVATRCAWSWEGSARDVVVAAKARGAWAGWEQHGATLAALVRDRGWPVDVVTGVPTPRRVVRRRGIDHGLELARSTAAHLELPVAWPLAAPSPFEVVRPVSGSVLLVDDVVTTGGTVAAVSAALARAGADRVWVAALARGGDSPGQGSRTVASFGRSGSGSPS